MNFKHIISYTFFLISLILLLMIGFKQFGEKKKIDHKYLIVEVEKQKKSLHEMSDQVIKMTNDLKTKSTDTIRIYKNNENIVVKLQEKELVIRDTILQYINNTDTITQYITMIDTVYIKPDSNVTIVNPNTRRRFIKKN